MTEKWFSLNINPDLISRSTTREQWRAIDSWLRRATNQVKEARANDQSAISALIVERDLDLATFGTGVLHIDGTEAGDHLMIQSVRLKEILAP